MKIIKRLADYIMFSREPDVIIGADKNPPYIKRWWVIPRNPFFNIYLHLVQQDDDDRALHDHMYINMSYVVEGGYHEHTINGLLAPLRAGQIRVRRPSTAHRLELIDGARTITFFITGPRIRQWGFITPKGWVHWKDFVGNDDGVMG